MGRVSKTLTQLANRLQNNVEEGALVVVSQNRGPQYRPQNTIVFIMGTPKKVLLILGNP